MWIVEVETAQPGENCYNMCSYMYLLTSVETEIGSLHFFYLCFSNLLLFVLCDHAEKFE